MWWLLSSDILLRIALQVAEELMRLRASVHQKDDVLQLAQIEIVSHRDRLEKSAQYATRMQEQVVERTVRIWQGDLLADTFVHWAHCVAAAKRTAEEESDAVMDW